MCSQIGKSSKWENLRFFDIQLIFLIRSMWRQLFPSGMNLLEKSTFLFSWIFVQHIQYVRVVYVRRTCVNRHIRYERKDSLQNFAKNFMKRYDFEMNCVIAWRLFTVQMSAKSLSKKSHFLDKSSSLALTK